MRGATNTREDDRRPDPEPEPEGCGCGSGPADQPVIGGPTINDPTEPGACSTSQLGRVAPLAWVFALVGVRRRRRRSPGL